MSFVADGTSALVSREEFISSFDVGKNSKHLKIRSAEDKGRKSNARRSVADAMEFPYISPNSDYNISWLVFDIDREFNPVELEEKNIVYPNYAVYNPDNGHAHLWYRLKVPVYSQSSFKSSKPFKFCKAVYNALRKALGADEHFAGKLCKNPFHKDWKAVRLSNAEYTLAELSAHLELNFDETGTPKNKARKIVSVVEAGEFAGAEKGSRNSSLFDFCRAKAYARRKSATDRSETEFVEWCVECVREADRNNPAPLGEESRGEREVRQIGESIGYWTWANLVPLETVKAKYDDEARAKSLRVRRKKAAAKVRKVERYLKKHPDASNREIARALGEGFSTDTVNKAVKRIEEERRAKAERSRESAAAVVGIVPSDDGVSERFVNQVVVRLGGFGSGDG